MGYWMLGIIIGLVIFGFTKLPESTQEDIKDVGKGIVENVLENETILDTLNSTLSENNNSTLEKIYLGKPMKTLEFDCLSDEDCVESFCSIENGECFIII